MSGVMAFKDFPMHIAYRFSTFPYGLQHNPISMMSQAISGGESREPTRAEQGTLRWQAVPKPRVVFGLT